MAMVRSSTAGGSFLRHMGIARRLWLVFGLLLVLIAAQLGIGMLALNGLNRGVDAVMASGDLAVFAKDLETRLANQRIQGRDYIYTGAPAALERQRALRTAFETAMAERQELLKASPQAGAFAELAALHTDYHSRFEAVRTAREQADRILHERMDPLGARVTAALEEVIATVAASGNKDAALDGQEAEKRWITIRFAANRALGLKDMAVAAEVEKQGGVLTEYLDELSAAFQADPKLSGTLREIDTQAVIYRIAFRDAMTANAAITQRAADAGRVATRINDTIDGIVAAIQADQKAIDATAERQSAFSTRLLLGLGLLSLLIGLVAAKRIAASIIGPVAGVRTVMTDLSAGKLFVTVPHADAGDELGDMARAVALFKDEAVEAVRSRIALDRVSANIMMVDTDDRILYANGSILTMFAKAEADLKKDRPGFDAKALIGRTLDIFDGEPGPPHRRLADLTRTDQAVFKAGDRTFRIVANPMLGKQGERLGTVIEWRDLTEELAIEGEIALMVERAVRGDFSHRVDLAGKTGFLRLVSEGINRLSENIAGVTEELAAALAALAHGDLTRRIDRQYDGVFQRLKEDFNGTVSQLSLIVRRIDTAAGSIATASREVADGSLDLSERTEQQASSLEETAASMEELAGSVRSNADNAQQVNHLAADARTAAARGGDVAVRAVEAMRRIERSSQKIADIIGVIDEIAFQTNLLALNAAVEAARAGEAGRGFAVVAQEVRQLAQRSAQASKEIKALILDSETQVRDGVDLVRAAGTALTAIVTGIGRVADLVAEIAQASAEQADQLREAMTSFRLDRPAGGDRRRRASA